MADAKKDANYNPSLIAVSNADSSTIVRLEADPTTKRLLVDVTGGKAVDDAAGSTDSGTNVLAVRDDSLSTLTPAEGDYVSLRVNSTGALHVIGGGGGTQYDTNVAYADGNKGTLALVIRDDALTTLTEADGDFSALRVSSTGELHVTGGGGGTQFAEDAAHTTGDKGTYALAVRKDTPANLSGADGDYEGLQVSAGRLWASTLITGDALTALQLIDNIVSVEDTAHTTGDSGVMALAVRNDALAALAGTDGDYAPLQVNASGALFIQEGSALDVSAATVTVDLAGNNDVTIDNSSIVKAEDAAHSTGDAGIMALAVRNDTLAALAGTDGDYAPLQVNASGALFAEISTALPAGTNAIGKLAANSGVDIGDVDVTSLPASTNTLEVVGDVAHDAAAAGNPVAIAARATNSVEGLTQVAAADASFVTSDLNGVLVTRPHTTLEEIISERVANTNGTSTNYTNFAAGGAGVHNYVTTITIYNSSATDGYVDFRDGSAGSVIFTAPAPSKGGSVINFPVPLKGAANTALAYDVSGALSTVYISVVGFQAQG